jgi:hypothetical protein
MDGLGSIIQKNREWSKEEEKRFLSELRQRMSSQRIRNLILQAMEEERLRTERLRERIHKIKEKQDKD